MRESFHNWNHIKLAYGIGVVLRKTNYNTLIRVLFILQNFHSIPGDNLLMIFDALCAKINSKHSMHN